MAEPEKEHPSLELPTLGGLRRRSRRQRGRAPETEPAADAADVAEPSSEPDLGTPTAPVAAPTPAPVAEPVTEPTLGPTEDTRPVVLAEPEPVLEPAAPAEPRRRIARDRGPGGMLAAVVTGLVVGLGIVGLTWASLRSCEGIQGTSSCGDVGYPMLALILVVMVVVGALLLRLTRVVDLGTTSFLGVGLAVVVALLVLVDHLMDRSMVVVVPLVCAVTFALAHGVPRTFIEPPRD